MNYSWKVLLPLFLGTVIMMFVLQKQGSSLKTENTPLKIVSLELAKTKEEVQNVLKAWEPDENTDRLTIAGKNIYLDFIFILFYSLFLFAACRKIRYHSQKWQKKAGKNFAFMGLAAGGFDIIENILMLRTLDGNYDIFTTLATFVCAAIKFTLIGFAVIYILLGFPRLFRSRKY